MCVRVRACVHDIQDRAISTVGENGMSYHLRQGGLVITVAVPSLTAHRQPQQSLEEPESLGPDMEGTRPSTIAEIE